MDIYSARSNEDLGGHVIYWSNILGVDSMKLKGYLIIKSNFVSSTGKLSTSNLAWS